MPTPQKIRLYYDPRGQVVRTINPDDSEQRVVFGIPDGLNNTEEYTPTPWETYTYDANDLASITHANEGYLQAHAFTPKSAVVDALGRTVKTTEHKAHINSSNNQREDVEMQYEYDIRGNNTKIIDPLNRVVFLHQYDLGNKTLLTKHIDSGEKRNIADALGKPIQLNDEKGSTVLISYCKLP